MRCIGFDYGTSHCAAGTKVDDALKLLPLEGASTLLPSMLWYPDLRFELPVDADGRLRTDTASFSQLRFGQAALERYLQDPAQGYFVKSPKSFLGAPGLLPQVRDRFERIVAAMMANVRLQAEAALGARVDAAVIGRPVNFQGPAGSVENEQALDMLRTAAHMAGFERVGFMFEPLAAALEYEAGLNTDQLVLVVDVGGGTTDCSLVQVGPKHRAERERVDNMLGHSGERVGGNDYDQALALAVAVPHLGWQAPLRSGLPVPNHYLVDAITVNDVNAQARFYSAATLERLEALLQECTEPRALERLLKVQRTRAGYRLLGEVEAAKISLSSASSAQLDLSFIEQGLALVANQGQLASAVAKLLDRLERTVRAVTQQASQSPDLVYLTGGMAQSPVVRQRVRALVGDVPLLDSDHFTSVTEGLTRWAQTAFSA